MRSWFLIVSGIVMVSGGLYLRLVKGRRKRWAEYVLGGLGLITVGSIDRSLTSNTTLPDWLFLVLVSSWLGFGIVYIVCEQFNSSRP